MDENVKNYLRANSDNKVFFEQWDDIFELTNVKDIALSSSSTVVPEIRWGIMPITYNEEIHHEEI